MCLVYRLKVDSNIVNTMHAHSLIASSQPMEVRSTGMTIDVEK